MTRGLRAVLAAGSLIASCGTGLAGTVCGLPTLQGEVLPPMVGEGECGIDEPVRLRSVRAVALDPPPTLSCEAARALDAWVVDGAKAEISRAGLRLVGLDVSGGYECRGVNRAEGGRISEHGRGRAIDIWAFRLADGRRVTVLEGWDARASGALLRRIHRAACGPFGTTLGPGSDGFHEDHFHYDVPTGRTRSYCR